MGCCCASEETTNSESNQTTNEANRLNHYSNTSKILIIGIEGSGKTTLFNNIKGAMGGTPFNSAAQLQTKSMLRSDLIWLMSRLILASQSFEESYRPRYEIAQKPSDTTLTAEDKKKISEFSDFHWKLSSAMNDPFQSSLEWSPDLNQLKQSELDEIGSLIEYLWSKDWIQYAFKCRGYPFRMPENMQEFFPRSKEIMSESYQPSKEDIRKFYIPTKGSNEFSFKDDDGHRMQLIDVGSQPSNRRDWEARLDDIEIVTFVVALNHYNEVLFEDESVNAMHETVKVFTEYANDERLSNVPILVFTKRDLFEQSLKDFPLSMCFGREIKGWDGPEYWEGPDYALMPRPEVPPWELVQQRVEFEDAMKAALDFIMDVFKNRYKGNQNLFKRVLNLTDPDSGRELMWDVRNIIIKTSLLKSGLMKGAFH